MKLNNKLTAQQLEQLKSCAKEAGYNFKVKGDREHVQWLCALTFGELVAAYSRDYAPHAEFYPQSFQTLHSFFTLLNLV